jgi:hypothetical protein
MSALPRLTLIACLLMGSVVPVFAQSKPEPRKPAAEKQQPAAAAPAPVAAPPASTGIRVQGFRSAKFGMSEDEVRAAVVRDFSIKTDALKTSVHPSEKTQVLSAQVADVLPDGGAAELSYVFGYKTRKLIQIALQWSKTSDPAITSDRLIANADALRNYFMSAGYVASSVATNGVVPGGILYFRGEDAEGHATVLILNGAASAEGTSPRSFTPTSLTLVYLVSAKNPDIYQIPPGAF